MKALSWRTRDLVCIPRKAFKKARWQKAFARMCKGINLGEKNEMDIKFYCPSDELIPTRLRLEVDGNGNKGKQIHYEKVKDEFAYDFTFYNFTENEAFEAAKIIGDLMESQSEDHGSSWRVVDIKPIDLTTIRIRFRIRDSY